MTNYNNQWVPPSLRKEWQINVLREVLEGLERIILTQPPPSFLLDVTLFTVFFGSRPLGTRAQTAQHILRLHLGTSNLNHHPLGFLLHHQVGSVTQHVSCVAHNTTPLLPISKHLLLFQNQDDDIDITFGMTLNIVTSKDHNI